MRTQYSKFYIGLLQNDQFFLNFLICPGIGAFIIRYDVGHPI